MPMQRRRDKSHAQAKPLFPVRQQVIDVEAMTEIAFEVVTSYVAQSGPHC